MITKLASLFFSGNEALNNKNVKGYNSAVLEVTVDEGDSLSVGVFITKDGTAASSSSQRAPMYYGTDVITRNVTLNSAGIYKYLIDLSGVTNIAVTGPKDKHYTLSLSQTPFIKPVEDEVFAKKIVDSMSCDVSRYNTGYLKVKVLDSEVRFNVTGGTLYNGGFSLFGNQNLSQTGEYDYRIDLTNADTLSIGGNGVLGRTLFLELSDEPFVISNDKVGYFKTPTTRVNTKDCNSLIMRIVANGTSSDSKLLCKKNSNSDYVLVNNVSDNLFIKEPFVINDGYTYCLIDCLEADDLTIELRSTSTFSIVLEKSNDLVNADSYKRKGLLLAQNDCIEFSNAKDIKQIEFDAKGSGTIVLEGSNDGFTSSTSIRFLVEGINTSISLALNSVSKHIFANVEGFESIRIRKSSAAAGTSEILNIIQHEEYVEGKAFLSKILNFGNSFYRGYKYFKLKFLSSAVVNGNTVYSETKGCTSCIQFIKDDVLISASNLKYYDFGMNEYPKMYLGSTYGLLLHGNPTGGGYIVELPEAITDTLSIVQKRVIDKDALDEYSVNAIFEVECYTEKPKAEEALKKMYDKEDYTVYKVSSENVNKDVFNHDVLEWTDNSLIFWQNGYLGIKYNILFDSSNVAHFTEGEKIKFAYLLPMVANDKRDVTVGQLYLPSRITVFTDSHIYHNYPVRGNGKCPTSDLQMFDESIIYNRYKRWLPTNSKEKADAMHKYFPVLADYDYSQFDGRVNGTDGYVDVYGNGSIPNSSIVQDIPVKNVGYYQRLRYSNMTKGQKWCTFGNYNLDPGSEPFVMSTNTGGRIWQIQAYFACTDFYNYMSGGKIDLSPIANVAPYTANSLKMCRKRFNLPTDSIKEPATPFIINEDDKSLVTGFSTDSNGNCVVTVADDVDYDGIYPIIYFENVGGSSEWDYICNNGFNATGTTNNGIFFRAEKISSNKYRLYADLGNPYEGEMVCRHIHAVNAVEPGVLISTGESYSEDWFEGGFLYLIEQNNKNGGVSADLYSVPKIIRLCSTPNGVNRACGAFLFTDNADPTLLYVSDEAFVVQNNHKRYANIPGRTAEVPITPAGIFVGKLSDVDDQTKFRSVCELGSTVVGLTEIHGHFAAEGHYNAICFSKDGFHWDMDIHDGSLVNGFDNHGNIYFGNKVVVFK